MKLTLQTLAYKIFSYCLAHNIDLHIQWIPRELNTQGDFISKFRDCNDWQITRDVFQQLDGTWGPHTLDCFASFYNSKIERFFFAVLDPRLSWGKRVFPAMDWRKLPFSSGRKYCYEGS